MARAKPGMHIVFVLDMTGSMASVKRQAIDGYNEYVTGMQNSAPEADIALTTFNSDQIKTYPVTPIKEAMLLNDQNYQPNATTPLYDAIGQTVRATEKRVKAGDRVAFVILTDGMENASREYNRTGIFAMLKEKEAAGWGIVYLGANQDAYQEAMGMGIQQSNVANFAITQTGQAMGTAARIVTTSHLHTGKTAGLMDDVDKDALVKPPDEPPAPEPPPDRPAGRKRKRLH